MTPYNEGNECDPEGRSSNRLVTEDRFTGEHWNDIGDDTHRWKNHDVNRRVRVEPEEMLEQNRVTAEFRIENTDTDGSLKNEKKKGDRQNRSRENLND